jgi:nitroreductase
MAGQARDPQSILREAAAIASLAPSIHNTQPWQWLVHEHDTELYADRTRQLLATDPDGRSLTLSCGVALQHAQVALRAAGYLPDVVRLPDLEDEDLLARVTLGGATAPSAECVRDYQSMLIRHMDRRPFADRAPSEEALRELTAAADAGGAHLHLVRPEQVTTVTMAVGRAGEVEQSEPAYRRELHDWTHRDLDSGEGLPAGVLPEPAARRVPIRDFAPDRDAALPDEPALADRYARYAVLYGDRDDPAHWLRGGEALGAVLLGVVRLGLAVSPYSDPIEVLATRQLIAREVLSGLGAPYLVLRLGVASPEQPPRARTARRPVADTVVPVPRD